VGAGLKQAVVAIVGIIVSTFAGFFGGMIVPWWLGWIPKWCMDIESPSSPISIANTYIVFTTIIFVGTTLVLVVVGFLFAKQFADSKELQSKDIFDKILLEIKSSKEKGNALASAMLANPHIGNYMKEYIDSEIKSKLSDFRDSILRSIDESSEERSDKLSEQMDKGGAS